MKKISFLTLMVIAAWVVSYAQSWDTSVRAYISRYQAIALAQEAKYGVPAPITLAQGIVESGAGRSTLTRRSNNHFGVKAHGRKNYCEFKDDEPGLSKFRVYASAEESYEDHSRFLAVENRSRYKRLFTYHIFDYRRWAHGLQDCHYATDPNYAVSLIQIIERFQLYKINGGFKLRPNSRQTVRRVKRVKTVEVPVEIPEMDAIADDELTEEEETYEKVIHLPYVALINGVRCMRLYPGESLSTIAREHGISKFELLEYNEAPNEESFHEGDIVFLAKKKNKYTDPQDTYTVQDGDTWHSISQQFGVKLTYLLKKNGKTYADHLVEGETLKLK